MNLEFGFVSALITFFVSCAAAGLVCAVTRTVARKIGFIDVPAGRKAHTVPTPLGGGIGILAGVATALCVTAFMLPSVFAQTELGVVQLVIAAIGGIVIFAVGLVDDIKGLGPFVRLAIEIAIAVVLYYAGFRITAFVYFPLANLLFTVLWFVFIINAFNLLDTTDGLCAGVAAIITLMLLFALRGKLDPLLATALAGFSGALAGFLIHNFPPARMFLGDSGALLIGYVLALSTTAATFYSPEWGNDPLLAMATPLMLFAVPIYDTASVIVIRIRNSVSIFKGDRNHLPHRLGALGLQKREVIFIIYLLTAVTSSSAVFIGRLSLSEALLLLLQTTAIFVLLFIIETAGGKQR